MYLDALIKSVKINQWECTSTLKYISPIFCTYYMSSTGTIGLYAREIPDEIKSVIKGLDDNTRIAIIVLLLKKSRLSFTQLKDELHIRSNSSLSHHLTILQDGGLIENRVQLGKDKHTSYYTAPNLAIEILRSLFDAILVPSGRPITVAGSSTQTSGAPTSSQTYPPIVRDTSPIPVLIYKQLEGSGVRP